MLKSTNETKRNLTAVDTSEFEDGNVNRDEINGSKFVKRKN